MLRKSALPLFILLATLAAAPCPAAIGELASATVSSRTTGEADAQIEQRAATLATAGNFAAASELMGELIKHAPQRQDYWLNWADWSLTARRYPQAIRGYSAILGIAPANMHAHINLVLALALSGDSAQARDWLASIDREAVPSGELLRNLGIAEQLLGDCPAALKSLSLSLSKAPNDAVSWASLARCQQQAEARQSLRRAAELKPGWISPREPAQSVALQPGK